MTTDEMLEEIRALLPSVKRSAITGSPALELVKKFEALDDELSEGAEVPLDWCDDEDEPAAENEADEPDDDDEDDETEEEGEDDAEEVGR